VRSRGEIRAGGEVRRALGSDEGQHPAGGGRGGGDLGRAQRQARALARAAADEPFDPDRLARGQRGQGDQQAVSRRTWSRSASPRSRIAGSDVLSSSAPDEVRPSRPGGRRRHLSVDDRDHALGLEPAYPRGDLGGEGGLADAAHPVDDEPAAARARQVGGPATAFG